MDQIYPDEGLPKILDAIVAENVDYLLFSNNVVIDKDTVFADLVEESTFGYHRITLASGSWTLNGIVAHIATKQSLPIDFTPSGGDWTLFGYAVVYNGEEEILWAANFDGAPIVVEDGDTLLLMPIVGDFSKLPA